MRALFMTCFLVSVACAAPKVPAPKIRPQAATSAKPGAPLASLPTADGYTPSWTNIEVRADGGATARIDFKGKRSYFIAVEIDVACTQAIDLATRKVVMKKIPESLCAWLKMAQKPLSELVDICVATHGCDL